MDEAIFDNCSLRRLTVRGDDRGSLIALEGDDVPFAIRRVYYIFGTAEGVERGFHAHRVLRQVVVCVSGHCTMIVDDGKQRCEVALASANVALHIGPMLWHEMRDFSPDCVLMVLADAPYDESDYIRDYDLFLKELRT